ncbi:TOTE conflict system archaeo-eukaryotic primase domain-containing protein, partial [Cyanobacterium aponinum]|uniref:non-homologous end-joining DNA ligase LigD n=1 Tax=Cyanobacterium aponinum TaxID=379064 RepID=UPI0013FD65AC
LAKCGCIDLDVTRDAKDLSEALVIAQNIVKSASELGINLYIEYSGNRGFHVWVFLEKAITHEPIKKALRAIALKANFEAKEIYPKDLNSNIKLPCTTHLKTSLRCGFITPDFDVNNPEIDLESQGDLMAKFELTALDKLINIPTEVKSEDKPVNSEVRSKEEIKGLLESLGDHPSCIKHLLT